MKILLVDDDKNIRQTLRLSMVGWGHDVAVASSAEEGIRYLKSEPFDFVLTDFKLEGKTGIDIVRATKQVAKPPVTVVMTAFASFENAVLATKEGAYDYIPKPFSNAQLEHMIGRVDALLQLKRENALLKSRSHRENFFAGLTSPATLRLEEFVRKVSPTDATVLLIGESGTGKSELARLIHARSERAATPFVIVNCATLTENLLESELFGHVKGAFTGATQEHVGKLEVANHGTVLIDEVGELSLNGQAKLLRFLQERVIERVGGTTPMHLDVRVLAATNKNLEEAVSEGRFREDLYYRLNILECQLVPLRHRKEDVPVLIQRLLKEMSVPTIPPEVLKKLLDYSWPGNIRELRNTLERLVLLSSGRAMIVEDLPDSIRLGSTRKLPSAQEPFRSLEELEREHIQRVLSVESNQERAAQILGITSVTLWRKRKQYGLP